MSAEFRFFDPPPPEPSRQPKAGDVVVVYRESDRLLADAFGTDVPILAWGQLGDPEEAR